MKEYLVKNIYGEYKITDHHSGFDIERLIEIPDGSNIYGKNKICGVTEFYRNDGKHDLLKIGKDGVWVRSKYHVGNIIDYWVREKESTMQEQLDYADELRDMGESGWSKEKHSHYKKDVSHLKMIDPYRIADLYNLHPCAEHIMKKSLCAGNRGHKDTLRDIQDIIDTAERWKQMIEEDNSEI